MMGGVVVGGARGPNIFVTSLYVGSLVSGRNPGPMLRVSENLTWIEDSVSPG